MFTLHHVRLPVAPHLLSSGQQILDIHAERGSLHWVIGPAGSGKTVLLETLALRRPLASNHQGSLQLLGYEITTHSNTTQLTMLRRHISFIETSPLLQENWTVFHNVALPLRLSGMSRSDIQRETLAILKWLHLHPYAEYPAQKLSYALRQRVAIARSLINRPALLLVDLTSLEPEIRARLLPAFSAMTAGGCTTVLATHDPSMTDFLPAPVISLPYHYDHTPSSSDSQNAATDQHNAPP